MPDDTQDAKAQKLAAARKKLKEYQQRNNNSSNNTNGTGPEDIAGHNVHATSSSASLSIASSESELNGGIQQQLPSEPETSGLPTAASLFGESTAIEPSMPLSLPATTYNYNGESVGAIQVLINEKAQLTTELTKSRHTCRERELELEELRTEHTSSCQRLEQLQQSCLDQQRNTEQQRLQSAELQQKLAQAQAQIEDQQTHLSELEAQLKVVHGNVSEYAEKLAEKTNELEMAQLRVRQLSDESNINADNRVESLTQTQYMYEQQIRDLQAMVAQLTHDKTQANSQYQNYVEHQSSEITKLNERNAELSEELQQLQERERQLVEHVSGLERDIQKNLSLQAHFKETNKEAEENTSQAQELAKLQERLSDLEFERHEFQLKIKSQDDQLKQLQQQVQEKDAAMSQLEMQLERLQVEQPDQAKLLATMESDKVAASRALSQNVEMKQQLDELEQRFVQLTNDKAELVNKLDAEEFAHREMRQNYVAMEQRLLTNEERFKFKDEEMIRLSNENEELTRNQLMLQQQVDRLQHYEAKAYHSLKEQDESIVKADEENNLNGPESKLAEALTQELHHDHDHHHDHHHHHHHHHQQQHTHEDGAECNHNHPNPKEPNLPAPPSVRSQLPTTEAVEKLQSRFTQLISKVADLTEEKQSLEHLVLQLEGETETIGEYITLYQTQRRMLKQREYEKATQMRLLQAEREQLREKIEMLNNLVKSLGVELPGVQIPLVGEPLTPTSEAEAPNATAKTAQPPDSQQILHKIQDIITEIKENTQQSPPSPQHSVDHLNCCLGKFEVV